MTDERPDGATDKYTERVYGSPVTAAPNDAVLIRELPEGTQVRLRSGRVAEITANPRDGGWLFVRILEAPDDPSAVGSDDMAFCVDVIEVTKHAGEGAH